MNTDTHGLKPPMFICIHLCSSVFIRGLDSNFGIEVPEKIFKLYTLIQFVMPYKFFSADSLTIAYHADFGSGKYISLITLT